MLPILDKYKVVLASASPRRQHLLKEMGISYTIRLNPDLEETYPEQLGMEEIPVYLAKKKAAAAAADLHKDELLITADTIVWHNNKVINKPKDYNEACNMLGRLSDSNHIVVTGVCLMTKEKSNSFFSTTRVSFKALTKEEIEYYIENYKPFDKAGAYGIQEWIGYIGIKRIEGSYFNVMGLPVQRLYEELNKF